MTPSSKECQKHWEADGNEHWLIVTCEKCQFQSFDGEPFLKAKLFAQEHSCSGTAGAPGINNREDGFINSVIHLGCYSTPMHSAELVLSTQPSVITRILCIPPNFLCRSWIFRAPWESSYSNLLTAYPGISPYTRWQATGTLKWLHLPHTDLEEQMHLGLQRKTTWDINPLALLSVTPSHSASCTVTNSVRLLAASHQDNYATSWDFGSHTGSFTF